MSITTTLAACSQTVSANGPDGAVDAPSTLDDAIRYALSFIAQIRDNKPDLTTLAASSGGSLIGYLSSATGSSPTTIDVFLNRITSLANGSVTHSDGTNTITGSPRWFIGNNTPSADDAAMIVGRGLTGSYNTGAHGFRDESTMTLTGGGLLAYACYDALPSMGGAATYNHFRAFQSRPAYSGSGTLGSWAGFYNQFSHTGTGTANSAYGFHMQDAQGTGPITLQAALYCDPLFRGASNYCIYSQGTGTPSYHAGVWQTGSDIIGGAKGTFTSQVLGKDLTATGTPTLYSGSGGATLYYNGGGAAVLRGYSDNTGAGTGFIQFQNGNVICAYLTQSAFYSGNDNLTDLGQPSNRFRTVYAGTGAINTSDARSKQDWTTYLEPELRAWAKVNFGKYKFRDSVAEKVDGARWHFGVIAQQVEEAFKSEGLNAFDYGVLCYDEWPEVAEIRNEDGEITTPYRAAGNRYGVRYDEAFALECALMRARLEAIESKVTA